VNAAVVDRTEALAPDLVSRYFDQSSTFEFGRVSIATPNASQAASFTDEATLAAAISGGSLPPNTRAVIYDDENWNLTPTAQQLDPATYYRRAANAAHAAGLRLIAAPGTDLADVVNPGRGPEWERYLSANIAAEAARYADVYDVQSQSLEADTATYAWYVHQAAQQALAANPNVSVLAGLSTNNPGKGAEPASVLLSAAQTAQNDVRGWWLNDPTPSPFCPNCSGPYPQTVVGFLQGLSPPSVPQSPTVTAPPTTPTTTTSRATTPPPTITGLAQSHRRWREGRGRARIAAAKPPIGTTFRFTLNENASVRFALAQLVAGRKVKGRCVAQRAANRNRRACRRLAPRGSLSFSAGAGADKLIFGGRLSRSRKLKPGTYTVTVTATNAAGQRAARTLRFTIVPG
jgi:hypothetical protein